MTVDYQLYLQVNFLKFLLTSTWCNISTSTSTTTIIPTTFSTTQGVEIESIYTTSALKLCPQECECGLQGERKMVRGNSTRIVNGSESMVSSTKVLTLYC